MVNKCIRLLFIGGMSLIGDTLKLEGKRVGLTFNFSQWQAGDQTPALCRYKPKFVFVPAIMIGE